MSALGRDGAYGACSVELKGGRRYELVLDSRTNDPIALAYRRGYQLNEYLTELLPRFTRPGSCVLDLGAHIGTFSLAAAAKGCRVIAVDASPKHVDLLRRSAKLNGFKRMTVVHAAVGDHCGTVGFHLAGLWGMVAPSGKDPSHQGISAAPLVGVPAVTGDTLLQKLGCRQVDLVKMDVEGSEVAAVRGLKTLLTRDDGPVIAYECNGLTLPSYGHTTGDLVGLLETFGYTSYHLESGRFHPYRPGDFQPQSWIDVIALKPRHVQALARQIASPLETEEIIARTLLEARMPHEVQRSYIGRALEDAPRTIVCDPRVAQALDDLAQDSSERVRESVRWWAASRCPTQAPHEIP
jgi:FkbM family methyltransferase